MLNFNMNLHNILLLITTLELCILCMSEMGIHSLVLKVYIYLHLKKKFTLCWCKSTTSSVKVVYTYFSGDRIRLSAESTLQRRSKVANKSTTLETPEAKHMLHTLCTITAAGMHA